MGTSDLVSAAAFGTNSQPLKTSPRQRGILRPCVRSCVSPTAPRAAAKIGVNDPPAPFPTSGEADDPYPPCSSVRPNGSALSGSAFSNLVLRWVSFATVTFPDSTRFEHD